MNLYQQFQTLIPKSSQIIAAVQAEFEDGTTSCLTLDGQPIRVLGINNRTPGAKVFIEINPALGASIIGNAPDLTGYNVEI